MKSAGRTDTDSILSKIFQRLRIREEFGGICIPAPI